MSQERWQDLFGDKAGEVFPGVWLRENEAGKFVEVLLNDEEIAQLQAQIDQSLETVLQEPQQQSVFPEVKAWIKDTLAQSRVVSFTARLMLDRMLKQTNESTDQVNPLTNLIEASRRRKQFEDLSGLILNGQIQFLRVTPPRNKPSNS